MKRLTVKQQQILDYIAEFTREHEISPTVHELAVHFGIKSSTMFIHLRTLQRKNCLVRSSKARSIKLLSPDGKPEKLARRNSNAVAIPVIEDFRAEMITDPAAYSSSKIFLSRESCKYNSGTRIFAIKADDTLTDIGILPGDTLVIAAIPDAKEDALLFVEFEKKMHVGYLAVTADGTKIFKFANKALAPVKLSLPPQIIGTVIALKRYF
jgi:repressor LexA